MRQRRDGGMLAGYWAKAGRLLFIRQPGAPKLLFRLACEYLSSFCLIRPGVVKILERVATARERAREETSARLGSVLVPRLCAELDGMLAVDPVLGRTRLSWLGTGPVSSTRRR